MWYRVLTFPTIKPSCGCEILHHLWMVETLAWDNLPTSGDWDFPSHPLKGKLHQLEVVRQWRIHRPPKRGHQEEPEDPGHSPRSLEQDEEHHQEDHEKGPTHEGEQDRPEKR